MPKCKEAARRAEPVLTREGEPEHIVFRLYTLRGRAEYLRPCIQLVGLKHFSAEGRANGRKWWNTPRGRWGTPYRSLRGISYEQESKSETDSRGRLEGAETDHSGSPSMNGIDQLARLGPTNLECSLSVVATQTRKSPVGVGVGAS
jgi:hypothetical protein